MNESVAGSSPSNANSSASPPDWFLKRRARQEELARKNEGTLSSESVPNSQQAPNSQREPLNLDELEPSGQNSGSPNPVSGPSESKVLPKSELSEFKSILKQAGFAKSPIGVGVQQSNHYTDAETNETVADVELDGADFETADLDTAPIEQDDLVLDESSAAEPVVGPRSPSQPHQLTSPQLLPNPRPLHSERRPEPPPIALAPPLDPGELYENLEQTDEPNTDFESPELSVLIEAKPVKRPVRTMVEPEPERTPFQEFTHRWLGTDALGSYAISIVLHLLVAMLLSLAVFHKELKEAAFTTLLAQNSDQFSNDVLDDTLVTVDTSGGQTGEVERDLFTAKSVSALSPLSTSALSDGLDLDSVNKDGNGKGNGIGDGLNLGGFQMPEAGKTVKKGSFTVWTVPHDPAPGQSYKIIIQVQYKKPGQKLVQSDIRGSVRGTDRFQREISPNTTTIYPEAKQLVLEIPGALDRVQDTIEVHSTLLRETQRLKIVF